MKKKPDNANLTVNMEQKSHAWALPLNRCMEGRVQCWERGRDEVKHFLPRTRLKIKSLSVHEGMDLKEMVGLGGGKPASHHSSPQKPTPSFSLSNMRSLCYCQGFPTMIP